MNILFERVSETPLKSIMSYQRLQLKEKSYRIVLNTIRIQSEVSGADIARIIGYQPSTISNILKKLRNNGFIEISRIASSNGVGKPPTLWKIKEEQGYILGLECTPNEFRLSIVDFAGNVVNQKRKKMNHTVHGDQLVAEIIKFYNNILEEIDFKVTKILGLGIALPGLIDGKNGIVHYSRPFNISEIDIQKILADKFDISVCVANNANAGALGVIWFREPSDKALENIVFITINDINKDLGAGIIIKNELFDGCSGTAGEMLARLPDVMKIIEKAKSRYYIDSSPWDKYSKNDDIPFTKIISKAQNNDKIALQLTQKYSELITDQIIQITGFYNPEGVIFGGSIMLSDFLVNDFIIPQVQENFPKVFPSGVMMPELVTSNYGIFSVSMGAVALISKKIYN